MTKRKPIWYALPAERQRQLPIPLPAWDVPLVAPAVAICDEPLVCVSLNLEWATFLSGLIEAAKDPRYWEGNSAEHDRIEQSLNKVIEQMVLPCSQPSNSVTVGEGLAIGDTYIAGYDGTPPSVHYNAPDTAFDESSLDDELKAACRRNALCRAAELWVAAACRIEIERRVRQDNYAGFAAASLPILAGLVGNPVAWLSPWLALGALGFAVFKELFENEDEDTLTDVCAQAAVACCLADNLAGLEPTFDNFCGSLDECTGLSGHAEAIRAALAPQTCNLAVFTIFLFFLGTSQGECVFGNEFGCGCEKWCQWFDFTADDFGFVQSEGAGGTWQQGVGWIHGDKSGIGIAAERRVRINRFTGSFNIRYMQIVVDYQFGHYEPSEPLQWFESKHGGTALISKNAAEVPNGLVTFEWFGDNTGSGLDILIRSSYDDTFPKTFDGQVIVKSLKLAGCGANPFDDCNTCFPPYDFTCP